MTRPARSERFSFPGWHVQDGALVFAFDCDRYGAFEERVWFPGRPVPNAPDEALCRLIGLLHVALGVSTYKASAARHVVFPALSSAGQAMARRLYSQGLAEFFVRAGLGYPPGTTFAFGGELPALVREGMQKGARAGGTEAVVAFGGGKDSYVARRIVERAGGTARLASVVMADTVRDAIKATAPPAPAEPVRFARRSLDPKLRALDGALNGHVPITAINMLALAVEAALSGAGEVVFANERSADEPTMVLPGGPTANHQDSKSGAFEALMTAALAEAGGPRVLSVLRPYSEVWIARAFSREAEAHPRFTSCNRNFRLAGDATARWCGACGKCAFTSLILSPWLTREQHLTAFGEVMLDRPSLVAEWEALTGLTDTKPWDCVGTIAECRASLWRLGQDPAWRGSLCVREVLPRVLAVASADELEAAWEAALAPADPNGLPQRYRDAADGLAEGAA